MSMLTQLVVVASVFVGASDLPEDPGKIQTRSGSRPAAGADEVATVGSPVYEKFRYDAVEVSVLPEEAVKKTLTGKIRLPAGAPLYQQIHSNAKYKACVPSGPCGLDDDGDGNFDRIALDSAVRALTLESPAPYEIQEVGIRSDKDFKQVVTYLGVTNGALRLSYREFINDLARPAFTEELTFPLEKSFPQEIAFKDVRILVLGVDGRGLRYQVASPNH